MEVNFVKKNRDGKTYRVDMAQLPERCCVDALPATAILWFTVSTREESAANPGEDNVTVRNVYGETLRTDKKTLTRCVRRLSGNKLMMATIESGKEYNGVYVGCNLTKEEMAIKNGEQGEQGDKKLAVEIFAEFMTFEDNKALMVFVCPKNCKPFYNGKSYPSGCYYVMIADENKGTPFTIYKPNKFKKLFYIGEQEKLKDLHELSKSGVFKIERLDKALERITGASGRNTLDRVQTFDEFDDTREATRAPEHRFERKRHRRDALKDEIFGKRDEIKKKEEQSDTPVEQENTFESRVDDFEPRRDDLRMGDFESRRHEPEGSSLKHPKTEQSHNEDEMQSHHKEQRHRDTNEGDTPRRSTSQSRMAKTIDTIKNMGSINPANHRNNSVMNRGNNPMNRSNSAVNHGNTAVKSTGASKDKKPNLSGMDDDFDKMLDDLF